MFCCLEMKQITNMFLFDFLWQDWEFPHFMGDVDVNLPGLHTPHMQFKIPFFQKIFKEEYRIHITGVLYLRTQFDYLRTLVRVMRVAVKSKP